MNKQTTFIKLVNQLQCSPPENLEAVIEWVKKDKSITFFSWKMFNIANPFFDTAEADRFVDKERVFIKTLINLKIKFTYVKLVPDELPKIFYNRNFDKQTREFSQQVEKYFQNICPGTNVVRISQILGQNPALEEIYNSVFSQSIKSKISPDKLQKEVIIRQDREIAQKAFGLFAAETAIIFKYFQNPVLLAGQRSIDTYKYEFFRYPKNRPVLPKLFVL